MKTSVRAVARSGQMRVPISSLSRAQKLSAAALSKQDPVRPQLSQSQLPYSVAELDRGVFAAAVTVDHAAGLQVPAAVGHVEGVHDEFCVVVISHGITDDLTGGQVQPAGEVEPALGRVSERRLRRVTPRMSRSRITRATRLRFTRRPRALQRRGPLPGGHVRVGDESTT
ncbi:hypothetical protein GCM10010271_73580 [Streptomyces kurssanovii]|nr:hypothetical protein GCM10010271_73580 [Streptomyces kurssanovii]